LTGDQFFAHVAVDTLEYVRRDLTDAAGGFYSAEDADSVPPEKAGEAHPHKMEGAFYIWSDEEIGEVLGDDAAVFRARYGIRSGGNAPADPQGEFIGKNLLYAAQSLDDIASSTGRTVDDVLAALHRSRTALMTRRSQRPRPHLDDKVLTAWNGLMIAAFARAARVLEEPQTYLADAQRAATFVKTRMWDSAARTLLRRYRNGDAGVEAYAEDYAFLVFGLLELFQADGDPQWLEWSVALQQRQDELFWDPLEGGWFSTTGQDQSVLLRLKEDYDGAEPAASSVAVLNLLALAHLGIAESDTEYAARIELTLGSFANRAALAGRTVPMMLAALSSYHAGIAQVVLVGDDGQDMRALAEAVRTRYRPTLLTLRLGSPDRHGLAQRLPWAAHLQAREGRATAYLCRAFSCEAPTQSAEELGRQIAEM
jgi:uncharacterized protein YyaL (SSP411 family)